MQSIELVLIMLLAVVTSGYLVRVLTIPLPLPLVQIALGGLIATVFHHAAFTLDPSVFFLLFLPPLLFLDGWRIPKDGLFRDRHTIIQLALGLVVFTVLIAGTIIHWIIPAMPLPVAYALAAILSPTDPVAVSSITARVPMPRRLLHILEGESLLNDASGLVCFQFAVAAAVTGVFSLWSATLTFLWVALAGIACGVVFTWLVMRVEKWLTRRYGEQGGASILISVLTPFGAYLVAEALDASGILAAVGAGITMSYVDLRGRNLAVTRLEQQAVWNTIQFALNGMVFVLLGEQLPHIFKAAMASIHTIGHSNPLWLVWYALVITIILALLRLAWVWLSLHLRRLGQHKQPDQPVYWRLLFATSLAGVRGAITLAGILTLPLLMPDGSDFPVRGLAIFLATAVILISLVAASIGLPVLLNELELPIDSQAEKEEDFARRTAADAALSAIGKAQSGIEQRMTASDADIYMQAARRATTVYQRRLHQHDEDKTTPRELRKADIIERKFRLAGLQGERDAILRLARSRRISDSTSRRLIHEIDLLEQALRR